MTNAKGHSVTQSGAVLVHARNKQCRIVFLWSHGLHHSSFAKTNVIQEGTYPCSTGIILGILRAKVRTVHIIKTKPMVCPADKTFQSNIKKGLFNLPPRIHWPISQSLMRSLVGIWSGMIGKWRSHGSVVADWSAAWLMRSGPTIKDHRSYGSMSPSGFRPNSFVWAYQSSNISVLGPYNSVLT